MALWGKKKKDPAKFHEQALSAFEKGQMAIALRWFSEAINLEPTSERLYYRGVINDITGNPTDGIKDLRKATKLDGTNSQAWYSLSVIYSQRENIEASYNAVERAFKIDQNDFRIANHFANLMLTSPFTEHLNPQRALEISKHACELTSWEDPICLSTHQLALEANGQPAKAETIKEDLVETIQSNHEDLTFELIEHFEIRFKKKANVNALQNIVPATIPIAVQTIQSRGKGPSVIFTTGMSGQPMKVVDEDKELKFAELMMVIPGDYTLPDTIDESIWPWHSLQMLANVPHMGGAAITNGPQVVSTNGKPEPLSHSTDFAAFLFLPGLRGYVEKYVSKKSNRSVTFITVVPIYAEEYALGAKELFERIKSTKTKPHFVPGRPNLALSK